MTEDKNDFAVVRTSAREGRFGTIADPENKAGNLRKVNQSIAEALRLISEGIKHLKSAFPNRNFTIDGRLVGDIGETIAALEYDVNLHEVSQPKHDGLTSDGRNVQIKATFKDSLTFGTVPDYYLGFKLNENGEFEEIFNGPGKLIYEHFRNRRDLGTKLLSLPRAKLRELSRTVQRSDRIPRREEV
jgi:hypothetical protein